MKSHLESNAVEKAKASLAEGTSLFSKWQKHIVLAGKSDVGWKAVDKYVQNKACQYQGGRQTDPVRWG